MSIKFFVFVYGTLKIGEPNHYWLDKNPKGSYKFICNAETIEKYPLVVETQYHVPFLLHKPGTGHYVKGELYEVDEKVLANLDILEEHPTIYEREEKIVKRVDTQETTKAWIYFKKKFRTELLDLPLLEKYTNKDQGYSYVSRERRYYNLLSVFTFIHLLLFLGKLNCLICCNYNKGNFN
ncbi:hypothetical protein RN001_000940 [Aquatica leii]|uniref:Gamma-glutamylcyclotransferase family protein n=1 Tax=Aquatica leii TaxID=1421715 RepID=A0AAN7SKW9_9COLE|nr:hypothetical protein RN001_000940 [Aquatica leii]